MDTEAGPADCWAAGTGTRTSHLRRQREKRSGKLTMKKGMSTLSGPDFDVII